VLGFHRITDEQQKYFNSVFLVINILPINHEVIESAIKIRRTFNLSVGDSSISATANIHNLTLYTNNEDDFKNIPKIKIFNPLKNNKNIL
jgi:toxin FitB